tara:strand:+ start:2066 stop:2494 length:429 start_codon:yes stop_codon:yes gene_type:complete
MENSWFNIIDYNSIKMKENIPKWLEDGVKDDKYVILDKNNYEIKCEFIEREMKTNKDKLTALEIVSITNSTAFKVDMDHKERIIRCLESKISRTKKHNENALQTLKDLQEKYNELKQKCDSIQEIIANMEENTNDTSIELSS